MKPHLEKTKFGLIRTSDERYPHDILIRWDGKVRKRKSRLSKKIFGTGHIVSLDEAKQIYKKGAERLIVGTGHFDKLRLSAEASAYFEKKGVRVSLYPTPKALEHWNDAAGKVIGLFHVTC